MGRTRKMSDVTLILGQIERGNTAASAQLLPLVYRELRALASFRLEQEPSGQTLQPTALVHEAYVRLVNSDAEYQWSSRGHFFGAAAEAMRRILIDRARQKRSLKAGANFSRVELCDIQESTDTASIDLLALDDALSRLEAFDSRKAKLVNLRFFAGLTTAEAAGVLGVSVSTAENDWAYARCWLRLEILGDAE